jgi:hypothetical protein
MDRRLLFPAVAVTAWAQQTSPANVEAEKALRARAQQFYQLEVEKKFRVAEGFVAEDTKDYFYNNGKPDIRAFELGKITFTDDGTRATIALVATVVLTAPEVGSQEFKVPASPTWKLENGEWVWYANQSPDIDTPFGKWHTGTGPATGGQNLAATMASPDALQNLVSIDRTAVELTPGVNTITISNQLPGPISVAVTDQPAGLKVDVDKPSVGAGDKAIISFSATGTAAPSGTVRIVASPINKEFLIRVNQDKDKK